VALEILAVCFGSNKWLEKQKEPTESSAALGKVGKRIDWFWEAYWKENGSDVSRQSSDKCLWRWNRENKVGEARLAAEEWLLNLRRSN